MLLLAAGVGVMAFMKMGKKPGDKGAEADAKKHVELQSWKLEEFVVNLADRDSPRYLKVNLVLDIGFKGKKSKHKGGHGHGAAANPEEARARDAIIAVLTSKSYNELLSEDGKTKLKADVKKALNAVLEDAEVVDIYFTSFAMQ
jgi:flagellar protein FliL